MNESDCSWIFVTAWKTDTTSPITRPTISSGPPTFIASSIACWARLTTVSWSMSVEALHERLGDQAPAVHEDEQEDLERQRDEDGRQHDHPHRHQGRGDDQVDHEERQEDQEGDLGRRLELADDESREENRRRGFGA